MKAVGARLPRYDGVEHVTGGTGTSTTSALPGTLWAKALRSPHHHAAIARLDTTRAEALTGVSRSSRTRTCRTNVYGHLEALGVPADEPLLADGEVRYRGQPIAVVAAETRGERAEAVAAIDIAYEERPALFDMRKAFDPDAPQFHQWGNRYPHFGRLDRAGAQGRHRQGVRRAPT